MSNLAAAFLTILGFPLFLLAQGASPNSAKMPPKSTVPRASDGKPDLSGVWQPDNNQRGSWEEANAGVGLGGSGRDPGAQRVQSSYERPKDGPAPYQPWAAKKVLEFFNRRGIDDPRVHCLPPGVPRVATLGLYPVQIVQTPRLFVILYEYGNVHRIIPLNQKHPDDLYPTYMGDSVAQWDGDTLVVDVTGFNDGTWLQGIGTFHSESLHVTERYTRVDKDQINYEATMEDPNVFNQAMDDSQYDDAPGGHAHSRGCLCREQRRCRASGKNPKGRDRFHQKTIGREMRHGST
jgi:hypothetical protein